MKSYVPKDAVCQAIQFTGANKDDLIKELALKKEEAVLWKSDLGEIRLDLLTRLGWVNLTPNDWIVKDSVGSYKGVKSLDFTAWYREI